MEIPITMHIVPLIGQFSSIRGGPSKNAQDHETSFQNPPIFWGIRVPPEKTSILMKVKVLSQFLFSCNLVALPGVSLAAYCINKDV
jgi:hypothetical protein